MVVLTPAESKRLLAKAVAGLPEVRWAYANGRLAVTSGTTDSLVVEELTGEKIEPYRFCVGMSAAGMLTMSAEEDRVLGRFYENGQRVDTPYPEFIKSLVKGDVIIKGANAVDPWGNAGVLLCNETGGLVGAMFGVASARGIQVISPVGLEKQVVSVPEAAAGWGQLTLDYAMGVRVGMSSLSGLLVVTEIQALALLAGVRARLLACGGIGGNEGAVVLLLEGDDDGLDRAIRLVEGLKGEPKMDVPRHHLS
ncbi:MAG: hypothetical protein A2W26_09880 [Acidobacteria bacterium RBG_16_64_8]|nr:MAG: hypothetical protein A2W26_09880 [Acidobacteria bacterium RBG_16_64_8]